MKKLLLPLAILALLLSAADVWAKPKLAKPVVVVSFAGYDAMMNDIKFAAKLSDSPELVTTLDLVLALSTGGKGLAGLDKSRPWGLAILPEGDEFTAYGFVPVSDLDKLLKVAEPLLESVEKVDGGMFKLQSEDGQAAFVREQDGWALIADDSKLLAKIAADPLKTLNGLNKKYDIAVRFSLANLPAKLRDETLEAAKAAIDEGLSEQPDLNKSKAVKKAVEGFSKHSFEFFKVLIEELDHITIGWSLDEEKETASLDAVIVAKEGTELARSVEALKKATSNFGGFLIPDAAMTARITGDVPKSKVAATESLVALFRAAALQGIEEETEDPAEKKVAKKLIQDLSDILEQTVRSAKVDGAVSVVLGKKSATVITGGYVADGYALDKLLKEIIQIAKDEGEEGVDLIKLDAAKLKDIRLHTASIPLDEDDAKKFFGPTVDVAVGFGKQSVYAAVGSDALAVLKRAVKASAKQTSKVVPLLRVSFSAKSISEFIAQVGETDKEREDAAKVAKLLAKSSGKDHVTITARPVTNGVHYRIEVEPGILRMFGQMVAEAKEE